MAEVNDTPEPQAAASDNAPEGLPARIIGLLTTNRLVQIGVGVGVFLLILLLIIGFVVRMPGSGSSRLRKNYKFIPVFEQLTPMDAAQIRKALSFEKIPFRSEKDGRVVHVSIPKEFADEARLKMAELGLPEGGVVGFEIFDESQNLGATDYDRRIKYIRAISGELSRNISNLKAINSARVQIVMPEKRAFGETIPGSASVLINLKPNQSLSERQVRGIMHLVASSVENLKPEDVTVIDNNGTILSDTIKMTLLDKRRSMIFEMLSAKESEGKSPLELLLTFKKKLKENYEDEYTQKVKKVLENLYPAGSYLVFSTVGLKESQNESSPYIVSKIDVAILIDELNPRVKLTQQLKQTTFSLVASAIGYQKGRDRIVLEKVPFVNIDSDQVSSVFSTGERMAVGEQKTQRSSWIFKFIYAFVVITLIFIVVVLRLLRRQPVEEYEDFETIGDESAESRETVDPFAAEKFREFARNNEETLSDQLTRWLS